MFAPFQGQEKLRGLPRDFTRQKVGKTRRDHAFI